MGMQVTLVEEMHTFGNVHQEGQLEGHVQFDLVIHHYVLRDEDGDAAAMVVMMKVVMMMMKMTTTTKVIMIARHLYASLWTIVPDETNVWRFNACSNEDVEVAVCNIF